MVISKAPIAGRVKTRMCPPLTFDQAASLAAAALRDTVAACEATAQEQGTCRLVAVFEGDPAGWIPTTWDVVPQRTGGLDERLADAFEDVLVDDEVGVLVAMDTPQATPDQIRQALDALDTHDAVLGFTEDGGYWIVGLRVPNRHAFAGVPMSTDHTGADQLKRLQSLGMNVAIVEPMRDLDTVADIAWVAKTYTHLQVADWWQMEGLSS